MPQRVTLSDVAREANVSMMTVSRVVNNKDGISPETRQRVQAAIDRLGYRPSSIARGLVTNRTGTLGLVVPDNANPFFSEFARGVEHVAYAEGYNVFLCNTEESTERELAVIQSLEEKRVDGLILCSSRLDEEAMCNALTGVDAVVLVNRLVPCARPQIAHLMVNDRHGAALLARHLIQSGHRKIGFVAGPQISYSSQQRLKGYHATMEEAGLPVTPTWIHHCGPTVEAGKAAAEQLFLAHPEITALMCFNDLVAVGALQACAHIGRRVPDDAAIVGYDDIFLATLVTPSLTTCHTPRYQLGRQAIILLLDQINHRQHSLVNPMIEPRLIVRASAP